MFGLMLIFLSLISFNTQDDCGVYEFFFSPVPGSINYPFGDEFLNVDVTDHYIAGLYPFTPPTANCCVSCLPKKVEEPPRQLELYSNEICKRCDVKVNNDSTAFIVKCYMCQPFDNPEVLKKESDVFRVEFIQLTNYTSDIN